MKLLLLIIHALSFSPLLCATHRLSLKRFNVPPSLHRRNTPVPRAPSNVTINSTPLNLTSIDNLIYFVNLNVGGADYPVQLDTGSSDLWIKSNSSSPLPNVNRTDTPFNLTYALGWAAGYIAYAPITFAGLSITKQAFLEATEVDNPAIGLGARGIAGLGFTSLSSIDAEGNQTQSSADRSLLYNLFQVNPSEPNFIGFMLQRNASRDSQDSQDGSFSIGEYEPGYEEIADRDAIPTWPEKSPKRWSLLLDAIIVGDSIAVPTTSVFDAPSNKAVVLMDSGSSYTYAPKHIVDAIYGNVSGAHFDNALGQYVVPCSYEINMALQIGGQIFPVHPLDITPILPGDASKCVGSFIPGNFSTGANDFDWLVGDNFLRSVYAIYDFGDFNSKGGMGDPYMKMLSMVDPDQASVQFHNERGGDPKTNITFVGLNGTTIEPVFSLSQDVSNSIQTISKFMPAMLALVALNALLLTAVAIAGIFYFCRRRSKRNPRARPTKGRDTMDPMPMDLRNSYIAGVEPSQQPHRYEPVSMALTEDTLFAPPSPRFHKFDTSAGPSGDRPKSVA